MHAPGSVDAAGVRVDLADHGGSRAWRSALVEGGRLRHSS